MKEGGPLRQPSAATSPRGGIVGNGFIRSESGRHKCLPYKHGAAVTERVMPAKELII